MSTSAHAISGNSERPFYHQFAWAYDLLVTDMAAPFADVITRIMAEHGIGPGDKVLDAGCGTGRHAVELARRGFAVTGVDSSAELLAVAERNAGAAGLADPPRFAQADLRWYDEPDAYAAIVCRGVLNDVLSDADRDAVLRRFADHLEPGGLLLVDVRDWGGTVERYRDAPVFERAARVDDGELRFRSSARLRPLTQQLLMAERFVYLRRDGEERAASEFALRCWSEAELRSRLAAAGFTSVKVRPGMRQRSQDRLLASAIRRG